MHNRAFRRQQRQRLMAKRYARSHSPMAWSFPENYDTIHKEAGILARTSKRCSCIYCGNPRKLSRHDDPLQERLAKHQLKDKYQTWLVASVAEDPVQAKTPVPRLKINLSRS